MDNKPEFLYNVIVSGYYVNLIWPCQYGRFYWVCGFISKEKSMMILQ